MGSGHRPANGQTVALTGAYPGARSPAGDVHQPRRSARCCVRVQRRWRDDLRPDHHATGREAAGHLPGRSADFGADGPGGPDAERHHHRPVARPGAPAGARAQRGRAAGPGQHRRGAHRRRHARRRFGAQEHRRRRARPASWSIASCCLLPPARPGRGRRADHLLAAHPGDLQADPGHPDPGRHRRLHPVAGHGRRRQHPDLRAHERGVAQRQDHRRGDSRRRRSRLAVHPRFEYVDADHLRRAVLLRPAVRRDDHHGLRAGAGDRRAGVAVQRHRRHAHVPRTAAQPTWAHSARLFGMEIAPNQAGGAPAPRRQPSPGREGSAGHVRLRSQPALLLPALGHPDHARGDLADPAGRLEPGHRLHQRHDHDHPVRAAGRSGPTARRPSPSSATRGDRPAVVRRKHVRRPHRPLAQAQTDAERRRWHVRTPGDRAGAHRSIRAAADLEPRPGVAVDRGRDRALRHPGRRRRRRCASCSTCGGHSARSHPCATAPAPSSP